jgi:hypothetical protein
MAHDRVIREMRKLGPYPQRVAGVATLRRDTEDIGPAPDSGEPAGPKQAPHLVVAEPLEAQGLPLEDLG